MEDVKPNEHGLKASHKADDHRKHEQAKMTRMERHSGGSQGVACG